MCSEIMQGVNNAQKIKHTNNNGIGSAPTSYRRRRADHQKSAATASQIDGGGAAGAGGYF